MTEVFAAVGIFFLFAILFAGVISMLDNRDLTRSAIRNGCAYYDDTNTFVWKLKENIDGK